MVHVLQLGHGARIHAGLLVLYQVSKVGHLLLLHLGVDDELLRVLVLLQLALVLLLH